MRKSYPHDSQSSGRLPRQHKCRQLGQDLVEFALILPLLLALTFGIVDIAHVVFSYNTLANATREGARYGVVHPNDTAGIISAAQQLAVGLQCSTSPIVNPATPRTITVSVQWDCSVTLLTGIVPRMLGGGNGTWPLHAESTMRVE